MDQWAITVQPGLGLGVQSTVVPDTSALLSTQDLQMTKRRDVKVEVSSCDLICTIWV